MQMFVHTRDVVPSHYQCRALAWDSVEGKKRSTATSCEATSATMNLSAPAGMWQPTQEEKRVKGQKA